MEIGVGLSLLQTFLTASGDGDLGPTLTIPSEDPTMDFRFLAPLADDTLADYTVEAITLQAAFEQIKASPRPPGWYAVWCGLRLAGHVRAEEELVDLKTEPPSHANPFACGD